MAPAPHEIVRRAGARFADPGTQMSGTAPTMISKHVRQYS